MAVTLPIGTKGEGTWLRSDTIATKRIIGRSCGTMQNTPTRIPPPPGYAWDLAPFSILTTVVMRCVPIGGRRAVIPHQFTAEQTVSDTKQARCHNDCMRTSVGPCTQS